MTVKTTNHLLKKKYSESFEEGDTVYSFDIGANAFYEYKLLKKFKDSRGNKWVCVLYRGNKEYLNFINEDYITKDDSEYQTQRKINDIKNKILNFQDELKELEK